MKPSKNSIIAVIVWIIIFIIGGMIEAKAYDKPDYSQPINGWTKEELEEATLECVSKRLPEVKTETATLMLEKICFYDTIAKGKEYQPKQGEE